MKTKEEIEKLFYRNRIIKILEDHVKASDVIYSREIDEIAGEIAALEKEETEEEEEHTTCDGCAMLQSNGCMLDDSCPDCFQYSMWTSKSDAKEVDTNTPFFGNSGAKIPMKEVKSAEEILHKHGNWDKAGLAEWHYKCIMRAMEEYTNQFKPK
jgi:hypothetical protein